MKNKYGTLRYQSKKEVIMVVGMIFFMAALAIVRYKVGVGRDVRNMIVVPVMLIECIGIDNRSYMKHNEYITFGFSRKRFYKEQVLICLLREALVSIFIVVMHGICYVDLIKLYSEGVQEKMEMYHRIPVVEDFLLSFCMLVAVNLVFLIKTTWIHRSHNKMLKKMSISPRLAYRIQEKKEKKIVYRVSDVLYHIGNVIFLFVVLILYILSQEMLFRSTSIYRLGVIAVLIIIGVVLYFIGRARFKPEYI